MTIKKIKTFKFNRNIHYVLSLLLFISLNTSAQQEYSVSSLKGTEIKNTVRFNFIPVEMPTDFDSNLESTMGLLGVHYQIPINNWLYGGIGMYAAITGDQGGLFTLGAEIGINKKLYNNFYFDANFHFGGGGGYRVLVNDGAFINSNIGIQYKQNNYNLGIQYSHLNFYSGEINSNSISFFVEFPSILRYADYKKAQKEFRSDNLLTDEFWKQPVSKNVQQVRFDFFKPFGNSKKDNANANAPLTETLYLLGFEYQKYTTENTFIFLHLDAIYKGLRAGFMDLFVGIGYHPYQSEKVKLFTKFGVGAAGGRVAPEGGLMIYPSAGIDIKLTEKLGLSTHAGYYRAIAGDLEALTFGFGLKYHNFNGGTKGFTNFKTQGITFGLQNQTYLDVVKTDSPTIDLQLIAFHVNYDLTKLLYLIGEAGFAYKGESGGYAHGLVGLGVKSPSFLNNKLRAHLEGMIGAAGGAGVDSGEGLVVRPTAGLSYQVTDVISLFSSVGKMKSINGSLATTNINMGVRFSLSTLSAKK